MFGVGCWMLDVGCLDVGCMVLVKLYNVQNRNVTKAEV
jgi:hypothetical protein